MHIFEKFIQVDIIALIQGTVNTTRISAAWPFQFLLNRNAISSEQGIYPDQFEYILVSNSLAIRRDRCHIGWYYKHVINRWRVQLFAINVLENFQELFLLNINVIRLFYISWLHQPELYHTFLWNIIVTITRYLVHFLLSEKHLHDIQALALLAPLPVVHVHSLLKVRIYRAARELEVLPLYYCLPLHAYILRQRSELKDLVLKIAHNAVNDDQFNEWQTTKTGICHFFIIKVILLLCFWVYLFQIRLETYICVNDF